MDKQQWYTGEFVEYLLDLFNSAEEESCKLSNKRYDPYKMEHILELYRVASNGKECVR